MATLSNIYNEASYNGGANSVNVLTGIVDENNVRLSTYRYDSSGRSIEEYFNTDSMPMGDLVLSYSASGLSTAVSDPTGAVRSYDYTTVLGVLKLTSQSQPGGSGCNASFSNISYDTNGNVVSKTDFNGSVTTFAFDLARNLELSRVEGSGTAHEKFFYTQWHPTLRKPVVLTQPMKKVTYTFDNSGNTIIVVRQATLDTTGSQGLSANVDTSIPSRTDSYVYDANGHIITYTDADGQTTSYNYYLDTAFTGIKPNQAGHTLGDLHSIANSKGQVLSLDSYDKAGRVLLTTGLKGIVTQMSYVPRGWVSTVSTTAPGNAARTTSYSYDAVGQMIGVSNPDGTVLSFTYDAAHRLIGATDARGNTVTYILDNVGNRIAEQIKDPSGNLQRSITRSFDALNRLQQVSGSVQ
jgi:YD repeat-containing protein